MVVPVSSDRDSDTSNSSQDSDLKSQSSRFWMPAALILAVLGVTVAILNSRGMLWWCQWDSPLILLSSDVWSKHNSQHLLDPYAWSHFQHGLIFYWVFYLIAGKRLGLWWLLLLAVTVESGWELLENSPLIIDQYRENTASLEYYGDSILNSLGDILACMIGFAVAAKFKFRYSLAIFIGIELAMILTIRDSLLINILMLTYPLEIIKNWQMGGAAL